MVAQFHRLRSDTKIVDPSCTRQRIFYLLNNINNLMEESMEYLRKQVEQLKRGNAWLQAKVEEAEQVSDDHEVYGYDNIGKLITQLKTNVMYKCFRYPIFQILFWESARRILMRF